MLMPVPGSETGVVPVWAMTANEHADKESAANSRFIGEERNCKAGEDNGGGAASLAAQHDLVAKTGEAGMTLFCALIKTDQSPVQTVGWAVARPANSSTRSTVSLTISSMVLGW